MPTYGPGWNLVPRWRTMMLPGITASPPNFLTPSRRPRVSRPLREEPPAFLCAMCHALLLRMRQPVGALDFTNAQHGLVLAMPFLAPIIFPPLLFEDDDFCRSALLDDGGADRSAGEQRGTSRDFGAVADHQHFGELDDGAGFAGKFLDCNNVVLGDLVLFAAGSDHCKHNLCRNGLPRFGGQRGGRGTAADKSLVRGRRTIR